MGQTAMGAVTGVGANSPMLQNYFSQQKSPPSDYLQPGVSTGNFLTGGSSYLGNLNLLTPEQQNALSQILTQPSDYEAFTKSIVDPSLKTFQEQIIPAIQQSYENLGAGSSGALNRALAQSASDLSGNISQNYMQYLQQGQQNKLAGLGIRGFNRPYNKTRVF